MDDLRGYALCSTDNNERQISANSTISGPTSTTVSGIAGISSSPRSPFSSNYNSEDSRVWSSVVGNYLDMFRNPDTSGLSHAVVDTLPALSSTDSVTDTSTIKQSSAPVKTAWTQAQTASTSSKLLPTMPTTVHLEFIPPPTDGNDPNLRPCDDGSQRYEKPRRPLSASSSRRRSSTSQQIPTVSSEFVDRESNSSPWLLGARGNVVYSDHSNGAVSTGLHKRALGKDSLELEYSDNVDRQQQYPRVAQGQPEFRPAGNGTILIGGSNLEYLDLGNHSYHHSPASMTMKPSSSKSTVGILRSKNY